MFYFSCYYNNRDCSTVLSTDSRKVSDTPTKEKKQKTAPSKDGEQFKRNLRGTPLHRQSHEDRDGDCIPRQAHEGSSEKHIGILKSDFVIIMLNYSNLAYVILNTL